MLGGSIRQSEQTAVGTETRRCIKIPSRLQHLRRVRSVERGFPPRADRLRCGSHMVRADPNHAPAPRVHHAVGIAQSSRWSRGRGDCNGRPFRLLAIEALVCVVAEISHAMTDEVRAAAIFMHTGPHIEDRCAANDGVTSTELPSAARRTITDRPLDAAKPDSRGHDQVGGNRRGPRTVRRCLSFSHRNLSQPSSARDPRDQNSYLSMIIGSLRAAVIHSCIAGSAMIVSQ